MPRSRLTPNPTESGTTVKTTSDADGAIRFAVMPFVTGLLRRNNKGRRKKARPALLHIKFQWGQQ